MIFFLICVSFSFRNMIQFSGDWYKVALTSTDRNAKSLQLDVTVGREEEPGRRPRYWEFHWRDDIALVETFNVIDVDLISVAVFEHVLVEFGVEVLDCEVDDVSSVAPDQIEALLSRSVTLRVGGTLEGPYLVVEIGPAVLVYNYITRSQNYTLFNNCMLKSVIELWTNYVHIFGKQKVLLTPKKLDMWLPDIATTNVGELESVHRDSNIHNWSIKTVDSQGLGREICTNWNTLL